MSPPSIDIISSDHPSEGYGARAGEVSGTSGTTIVSVSSPNITYNHDHILSKYTYENAIVSKEAGTFVVKPTKTEYEFKTETTVPRVGYLPLHSMSDM
jgi:hypothetical protein